ncbi:MAG: GH25 family lysozyme [Verrucomicrobiota bacterium]|jgi:GH25 family lysozyme M1 (1,4-beta-N-acetylmuramidase)
MSRGDRKKDICLDDVDRQSRRCGIKTLAEACQSRFALGFAMTILKASRLEAVAFIAILAASPVASAWAQTELIVNGSFESGSGSSVPGWTLSGGAGLNGLPGSSAYAHTGSQYLILGGAVDENDTAYQSVQIPIAAAAATLSFYCNITSDECTCAAYDTFSATIRNTGGTVLATVGNWSNINQDPAAGNPYYHQQTYDLLAYKGQSVLIYFSSSNDSNYLTSFRLDDVSVKVTVPAPAPAISSVGPNPVIGSNNPQTVTVYGANFVNKPTLTLTWTGESGYVAPAAQVSFVSGAQVQMSIATGNDPDTWTVRATNPDGQSSSAASFQVNAPVPVIASLSPSSVTAGGAPFTLSVYGSTFHKTSVVQWNGANLSTTPVVDSGLTTALQASVPASLIASPGAVSITVYSPGPGGGSSSGGTLTINPSGTRNLVFGLDSSTIQQADPINWSGVKSCQITYNGENCPMTFVILRASKGNANVDNCRFIDSQFAARAAAAASAGLLVGAYHVASVTNENTLAAYSPVDEADFFVQVAGSWMQPGNLRPCLDVEDHSCGALSTHQGLSAWVDQWMQEVQRLTGVTPIIYCDGTFANILQGLSSQYELWIAKPGSDPAANPGMAPWNVDLIQYNWYGQVAGIDVNVGLDVFQGSQQSFQSKIIIRTVTQTGSLQVTITPSGAVSAGAQWQVDSGPWQSSGATVSGLSVGSHTMAFSTVSGWTTPGNQTVGINANQTTTTTGTYLPAGAPLPPQLTGATVGNGMFGFVLHGPSGSNYVIQVSSNLVNWTILATNVIPAGGARYIDDPITTNRTRRFYRAFPLSQGRFVLQPGPVDGKDIWTTSWYSYATCPGAGTGGGLNEDHLRVGGWYGR